MMRDVILGKTPSAFVKPIYVEVAVISALAPFLLLSINKRLVHSKYQALYAGLMFLMDSVGLGIFTAVGVSTGWTAGYHDNMFFLSFLGVLTGVGGGLLRDVMAGVPPYIFVKHVYACASIAGAICCVLAYRSWGQIPALVIGTVVVLVIRIGAAHYRWNPVHIFLQYLFIKNTHCIKRSKIQNSDHCQPPAGAIFHNRQKIAAHSNKYCPCKKYPFRYLPSFSLKKCPNHKI